MKILVIGSINIDFVVTTKIFPEQGSTVMGNEINMFFGGKGANQAVAASKLGSNVTFLGSVGDDDFGEMCIKNLKTHNIETSNITQSKKSTGYANIIVYNNDNRIIVIPGANLDLDIEQIDRKLIISNDIILLQHEIKREVVSWIINFAYKHNKIIILNPAPSLDDFDQNLLHKVTYLITNELEIKDIFGINYLDQIKRFPGKIIVTLGAKGAVFYENNKYTYINSNIVNVIDTTGAGDTFCGAFASAVSKNWNLKECVEFSVKAAGISVTKLGAQSGMPSKNDI